MYVNKFPFFKKSDLFISVITIGLININKTDQTRLKKVRKKTILMLKVLKKKDGNDSPTGTMFLLLSIIIKKTN
jgi:hypothetical protein